MERDSRQGAMRPPDHGLAALGLIMQLGGAVFLAYMAMEAATCIWYRFIHTADYYQHWHSRSDETRVAFLVIAATGVFRSALHLRAGRALLRSEPWRRLGSSYAYIAAALVQTALVLRMLNLQAPVAAKVNVTVALLLLAWPLTLLVVLSRSRVRAAPRDASVSSDDVAADGAAIVMGVLGAVGSLTALFMLYSVLQAEIEPEPHASIKQLLMLHVCVLLIARSVLHTLVGGSGVRDALGGASRALARYTTFGVISALAAGGLLLVVQWLSVGQYSHTSPIRVMGIVGLLLAWPLVLRHFHRRRSKLVGRGRRRERRRSLCRWRDDRARLAAARHGSVPARLRAAGAGLRARRPVQLDPLAEYPGQGAGAGREQPPAAVVVGGRQHPPGLGRDRAHPIDGAAPSGGDPLRRGFNGGHVLAAVAAAVRARRPRRKRAAVRIAGRRPAPQRLVLARRPAGHVDTDQPQAAVSPLVTMILANRKPAAPPSRRLEGCGGIG